MKKIITALCVLVLTVSLSEYNPLQAQRDRSGETAALRAKEKDNDNDHDSGNWGLLGLAGLLGLLGLKRNDDKGRVRRTETTRIRP